LADEAPNRKTIRQRHLREALAIRPLRDAPGTDQPAGPYIEPEQTRHERRARALEDLARRPGGFDLAAVHHRHRPAERERASLIACGIDGCEAQALLQHLELQPHLLADLRVCI
jgi:hypothetical protein